MEACYIYFGVALGSSVYTVLWCMFCYIKLAKLSLTCDVNIEKLC